VAGQSRRPSLISGSCHCIDGQAPAPAHRIRTYTAAVTDTTAGSAARAQPPRTILATAIALVVAAVGSVAAALSLFSARSWLIDSVRTSDAKAKPPVVRTQAQLDHDVSRIITSQLVISVVIGILLGSIAYFVWRGRYWTRWSVLGLFVLCTFTGSLIGLSSLLAIGTSEPVLFKATAFIGSVAFVVAVLAVNLRPSVQYLALSRPERPVSAAPGGLRGLFAPRPAPPRRTAQDAKTTPDRKTAGRGSQTQGSAASKPDLRKPAASSRGKSEPASGASASTKSANGSATAKGRPAAKRRGGSAPPAAKSRRT
jgi:hypothetical protein